MKSEVGCQIAVICGALLALLGIGACQAGCFGARKHGSQPRSSSSKATLRGDKLEALTFCQFAVKRNLKAPSSADFPWADLDTVTAEGSGRYSVSSYVDSQNSFGAKIRASYRCVLKFHDGEWALESLKID